MVRYGIEEEEEDGNRYMTHGGWWRCIDLAGETDLSFTEDVGKRYESYGWHVQSADINHLHTVLEAIEEAKKVADRPSLIKVTSVERYGCLVP